MTTIVQPENVTAPRDRIELVKILVKNMPNAGVRVFGQKSAQTCSIALVMWDEMPRLALRYDGYAEAPLGNPCSNSHPTWFIVPVCLQQLLMPVVPLGDWALVSQTWRSPPRGVEIVSLDDPAELHAAIGREVS